MQQLKPKFNDLFHTFSHKSFQKLKTSRVVMGYQKKGGQGSLFQKYYYPQACTTVEALTICVLNELTYALGLVADEKLYP